MRMEYGCNKCRLVVHALGLKYEIRSTYVFNVIYVMKSCTTVKPSILSM